MRTEGQTDGRHAFGGYANERKNDMQVTHIHSFLEILCDKQEWIGLEEKCLLKKLEFKMYSQS